MEVGQAYGLATADLPAAAAQFYGPVGDAAIGAGLVLNNVEYPLYLRDEGQFGVVRGLVLVLTHECDLDQENERVLNDVALVCPVIPLEDLAATLADVMEDHAAGAFIGNVTSRRVNRIVYIPTIPDVLPHGGYLYLNLLTNTHLSKLVGDEIQQVCMLGVPGFFEVDFALERHLRRPKVDRVPFQNEGEAAG